MTEPTLEITRLRLLREKLDLSQLEVARRLGWKQNKISRLESGEQQAKLEELKLYARALGANLEVEISQAG